MERRLDPKKPSRTLRSAILAACLWSLSAFATGDDCLPKGDPFAPSGMMPTGRNAGRCLQVNDVGFKPKDSGKIGRRSFRIISREEALKVVPREIVETAGPNVDFIANVSHDGDFWVGLFERENAIENMSFQIERFPPEWIAAHTEIRYNLKPGHEVRLFSQTRPGETFKMKSFITTVEGVPMIGGPSFNLLDALRGAFGLAKRIVSLEDKVRIVVFGEMNTVYQYRFDFDRAQLDAFWKQALEDLHDPEMLQTYHLLKKNCTNQLFELIDSFLERKRGLFAKVATALPISADKALSRRKVVNLKETLDTLNKEFNGPVKAIACKQTLKPDRP